MKVIIPLAGLGTRLRPHTYATPKPLVSIAGKPMLGYVLEELASLPVDEVIFITGYLGDKIEEYVSKTYPQFKSRFLSQKELLGQSHALYMAEKFVQDEVLIIFADTIFKADLASLHATDGDGVLHFQAVEDPSRFGVGVIDSQNYVQRLVEKPKTPVSYQAIVGVYYFKQASWLFRAIEKQFSQEQALKGEYYLADAISIMLEEGARMHARTIPVWADCGTVEAVLDTNRYLLDEYYRHLADYSSHLINHSVIIPPVFIGKDARIENSVIGPYVNIGNGVVITNSNIKNSIVNDQAVLTNMALSDSIIGSKASVTATTHRLNIGDDSQLDF